MGPHSSKCGKTTSSVSGGRGCPHFNGAALFQVRKVDISRKIMKSRNHFNGAALFQVRKVPTPCKFLVRALRLQWGRTLSSAESWTFREFIFIFLKYFNGAALFQVRKASLRRESQAKPSQTSMGPHSFKCGKLSLGKLVAKNEGKLQWGRTLSSAERAVRRNDRVADGELQWGRTLSSAERCPYPGSPSFVQSTSMGPHSFKCGKRRFLRPPPSV